MRRVRRVMPARHVMVTVGPVDGHRRRVVSRVKRVVLVRVLRRVWRGSGEHVLALGLSGRRRRCRRWDVAVVAPVASRITHYFYYYYYYCYINFWVKTKEIGRLVWWTYL